MGQMADVCYLQPLIQPRIAVMIWMLMILNNE